MSESQGEHVRAAVGERRVCADPVAHLQAPEPERVFVELLHRPSRTPRPARPRLVPSRFLGRSRCTRWTRSLTTTETSRRQAPTSSSLRSHRKENDGHGDGLALSLARSTHVNRHHVHRQHLQEAQGVYPDRANRPGDDRPSPARDRPSTAIACFRTEGLFRARFDRPAATRRATHATADAPPRRRVRIARDRPIARGGVVARRPRSRFPTGRGDRRCGVR